MTEFEAQLDFANNPAVAQTVQAFCEHEIMEPLLERMRRGGLPAQRYIKEILSIGQPLTHGSVTAKGLRNKADICGALSFLLESMAALPSHCVLNADFIEHPHESMTRMPLRRVDTQEVTEIEFVNHPHMRLHAPMLSPACYYITEYVALFERLLRRHTLAIERISRTEAVNATALHLVVIGEGLDDDIDVQDRPTVLELQTGWLRVSLDQPRGLLLPQLLEPQAGSSYFRHEHFHAMCQVDRPFFIYRG